MKWGKVVLVVFGAVVITALGIDASDTFTGSSGTLLSQVISKDSGKCPQGMSVVENISSVTCIDIYENSVGEACPMENPEQMLATIKNVEASSCTSVSKKDALPWRFITRDQAMQMCARSGKRIPTNGEWYALSLGMSDTENNCNVREKDVSKTGAKTACVSPHGAYDLVGNVWEWVSDDVKNGEYNSSQVPDSGYVAQVDTEGMAVLVDENPQVLFGKDYFWSKKDGVYGIIRGGYYDSDSDAGVYTVHADTLPTTASIGIGFRCIK